MLGFFEEICGPSGNAFNMNSADVVCVMGMSSRICPRMCKEDGGRTDPSGSSI